jgi:hypothetical protein
VAVGAVEVEVAAAGVVVGAASSTPW